MPGIGGIASNDVIQVTKAGVRERGASRTEPGGSRDDGKAVVVSFAGYGWCRATGETKALTGDEP